MDKQSKSTTVTDNRVLVIACGMLAREVLAIKAQLALDTLDLTCLPAEFHFRPDRIAPAMDKTIVEARARGYRHIVAGYADCGTGGELDAVLARHDVQRLAGPHCFAFYQGAAAFEAQGDRDMLAFYMTDFLCRHFDSFFMKPLALDRHPELINDFFGNYEKVVYLAQTDNPEFDRVAGDAAKLLGLSYERRFTGYGDLSGFLARSGGGSKTDKPGYLFRTGETGLRMECPAPDFEPNLDIVEFKR